jgi:hypothetical protein
MYQEVRTGNAKKHDTKPCSFLRLFILKAVPIRNTFQLTTLNDKDGNRNPLDFKPSQPTVPSSVQKGLQHNLGLLAAEC